MKDIDNTRNIIRAIRGKYETVREYCKVLGISRAWFYECLKKGKYERITIGL